MNETNLIERLHKNISLGDNCPKVKYDTTTMGTNSNIHTPKADNLAKDVKKTLDDGSHNNNKPSYEMVNHPKHYNNYDVEVVDMMEKIWGTKATMEWCKMTAYKYRMRMGTKPGENDSSEAMKNKLLEDFNKEQWYLKKADELKSKLFDKGIDMNQ